MAELDDKVAIVIGAGSSGPGLGNGKATAICFAREGATVVCADRSLEAAEETVAIIRGEGFDATAVALDATDEGQIAGLVAATVRDHGRIDVLDNNVGITMMGGVTATTVEDWDTVMRVNLTTAMLAMKHVIPVMADAGGGSIINISSTASLGWAGVPYASYYASKAALNMLTRTTAAEHAHAGVRVNAILPGMMKTPMVGGNASLAAHYSGGDVEEMWAKRARQIPMGFMGEGWDVGNAAVFLASDRARYVTGLELVVDGGLTLGWAGSEAITARA
ncbi:SDR family NAD(P)-dependent oxidoreductase [Agrococcus jejuensis]|uniref:NAD(P)-dependent dehydrogenase, short-chain alcohol dehydrogenase family n=1 Tax=Agrococcus jejuensis TaxID=399736 RepID=A0A1G8A041_9MICO|nr:SDR family oxidoreductase [Agrococcus jejuensis]SDH14314.1 NAD(P)-dependent dehydrogenase, short-chain alcohol dehydrogenase family [Agrococcus jejuensis]